MGSHLAMCVDPEGNEFMLTQKARLVRKNRSDETSASSVESLIAGKEALKQTIK